MGDTTGGHKHTTGLAGRGWVTVYTCLGEGSQLFLQRELPPPSVGCTHQVRQTYLAAALSSEHLSHQVIHGQL